MNLSKLNVQELSTNELKTVEGGFVGLALAAIAFGYQYGGKDAAERERR